MANTVGEIITIGSYDYTITKVATATGSTNASRGTVRAKVRSIYTNNSIISDSIAEYVTQGSYYYNVTNASNCYAGCSNLTAAPDLPSGLIDISNIFRGCGALAIAPTIPATVQNIEQAFYYCSSLQGSITFNTTSLTTYLNAFAGTSKDIYIIPGSDSIDITHLRLMAAPYGNVHYNTEDNPKPNIEEASIIRVASNNSTTETNDGKWLYIIVKVYTYVTYLPANSRINGPTSIQIKLDDISVASKTSGFSTSNTDSSTTAVFWVETDDETERHIISVDASDLYKDSDTFQGIISGSFATMDFHAGGDGVAIGGFSTGPGFVVEMDTTLNDAAIYGDVHIRKRTASGDLADGDFQVHDGDIIDKNGNVLTTYHLVQTPNTNIVTLAEGSGNMTVTVPAIWG